MATWLGFGIPLTIATVAIILGLAISLQNSVWTERQLDVLAFVIVVTVFSLVLNAIVWCIWSCSRSQEPGFYYYRARTVSGVPIGGPLTRGSQRAAGVDIQAATSLEIAPMKMKIVPSNLHVGIPTGYYLQIAPRSGFTVKNAAILGAGVIDEDYRGLVAIVVFNLSTSATLKIEAGDRIAQGILHKISYAQPQEVYSLEALGTTVRGGRGWGSSGK